MVVGCVFSKSVSAKGQAGENVAREISQCSLPDTPRPVSRDLMFRDRAQGCRKDGQTRQAVKVYSPVRCGCAKPGFLVRTGIDRIWLSTLL